MSAADFHAHPVPEPVALDMLRMVTPEDPIVFGSDYPHSAASMILKKKSRFDSNPKFDDIRQTICAENAILEILNAAMKKLADKYHVAIAQIPVAWAIAKGTLPIIGVTKENQVLDAAKAASITLTAEETAELESVADSLELNVIRFWEKEMK